MSHARHPDRKVVNFSAGPSAMPHDVLVQAQRELVNFEGTETSVMEISHRSATFTKIMTKSVSLVKELLKVPDNYKILFVQGGGNGQFAAVPLNLINLKPKKSADYFVTGYWSAKASAECNKYGTANLVFPKLDKFNRIPPSSEWVLDPEASFIHICENETINGVEFNEEIINKIISKSGGVPIVADCSSNFFSRPVDISKYGVIYAGAQKNFGPAGTTLLIVRDDLIGKALKECPTVSDYGILSANNSLYQTPPTFGIYMCGLVFEWLQKQGGLENVGKINKLKSELIYTVIDESNDFYRSIVEKNARSRMTLPFRLCKNGEPNEALEKEFIAEAAKNNLRELKGHRSVGGIRAALFNALSYEEVELLAVFMKEFHASHKE